ncbi:MAG TPA: preprotein translocase subunit SecD, partial [Halobacteria archaeon]|nr:preprotein translocase subunit SecD [Halobacteria archaeon]
VLILVGISTLPLIGWQLDLPSIAGIIATIGTGIDQLVIITDEMLKGDKSKEQEQSQRKQVKKGEKRGKKPKENVGKDKKSGSFRTYEKRLSTAFKIIFTSAATTIFAMIPLLVMGLSKLTGFALTIIIGVLIGVLVTRPAYGEILKEIIVSKD